MIQLDGTITAVTPLHVGNGRSKGTFIQTLDHIPGRTIRGMLGYYLYKNDMHLFKDIGIDEEKDISRMGIIFKNAYPVDKDEITVASPLIVKWCKKCGTLFGTNDRECRNVIDNKPCLHEGKKYSGLISLGSLRDKKLKRPENLPRQIETKCPITRKGHASMGSAEEGYELSPYHIESISAGAKFRFRILVKDAFADRVIESLKNAGTFYGLGGFRSRGYGSVRFENVAKSELGARIAIRKEELSVMRSKLLVMNSQIILRKEDESIIGFDDTFKEYAAKTLQSVGVKGNIEPDMNEVKISSGTARGWSLKNKNSLSELIPCIGSGSCVRVSGDAEALAVLEAYGIGEMINCGYGDVYVIGDVI